MSRVAEVMAKLPSKFQPQAAENLNIVFQIRIADGTAYVLSVQEQNCRVEDGEHPDPNVTLIMDSETFCDIIEGELGGTQAFLTGRLRAEGDVMLATKLSSLFKR